MNQITTWGAGKNGLYEKIDNDGVVETDVYCYAEMHALSIMYQCGIASFNMNNMTPHEAGNRIIEWAENIKAQRAVLAMNK